LTDRAEPAKRFDDRAGAYAAFRPGYPDRLIDALLSGVQAPLVADVGAGTGISAAALARRGARVIAIEPSESMRAKASLDPAVEWRAGNGHATGLGAKSVDIAACFQAFHWFADDAALAELERIARTRVAVVQYERDETQPFARAYGDLVRAYALDSTERRRMDALTFFESWAAAPRRAFETLERYSEEQLLGRVRSTSYLPQDGAAAEALQAELRELFSRENRGGYVELAMSMFLVMKDLA